MIRASLIATAACALALFACGRAHAAEAAPLVDLRAWAPRIESVQRNINAVHVYVACGADGRPCFDCVNFTIAKMRALEEIGLPPSAIRFVELTDKGGTRHAAAAVFGWDTKTGAMTALVLDQLMSWVIPLADYKQEITGIIMIHGGAE